MREHVRYLVEIALAVSLMFAVCAIGKKKAKIKRRTKEWDYV